jgi:hypothetical protein
MSDLQFCSLVAVGVGLEAPGDSLLEQAEASREAARATMPSTLRTLFCAYGFKAIPPMKRRFATPPTAAPVIRPSALTCGDFQCIYTEARGGI